MTKRRPTGYNNTIGLDVGDDPDRVTLVSVGVRVRSDLMKVCTLRVLLVRNVDVVESWLSGE